LVISAGCTSVSEYIDNGFKVGPNYQKPPAPVESEWIDSRSKGVNTATADLSSWWSVFNDPVLNGLVEQAYRQNLDLRTAGARILSARAVRNIAAGNLFPQLQQAALDVIHHGASANTPFAVAPRFFDDNIAQLNLAWEIDFWGRFRRAVEAADAELDASIENYDDVLVLLIAEVASTYVDIRVSQQRLRFIAENVAIQTELVKQAEGRLKGGVGRLIDQGQMRSNLTDTLALREQFEIALRQSNNRLCVLLGIPVRDLIPELGDGPIPVAPPEVAVGMPTDLLRRRPDVRRAERLVAAQSARIGIATSDLYPRFTLLGSLGYEAENFSQLFSSKSFTGSIGPSVRWDILNYGRLVNGIALADAEFQKKVTEYQSTVLRAGREVEDGIVLYLRSQSQTRQLADSAKEAKIAAEEAVTLSKDVKFDLNRAFVTSNFLVGQEDKYAVAAGDIAQGLIQVYKALGGGWQIRCAPTAVANAIPGPTIKEMPPPNARIMQPMPKDAFTRAMYNSTKPAAAPALARYEMPPETAPSEITSPSSSSPRRATLGLPVAVANDQSGAHKN